jgi:hypothetical protein
MHQDTKDAAEDDAKEGDKKQAPEFGVDEEVLEELLRAETRDINKFSDPEQVGRNKLPKLGWMNLQDLHGRFRCG